MNGKRSVKRSGSEGSGGIFRHFRRSGSGSHKSTDLDTAISDAPNGGHSYTTSVHNCMHIACEFFGMLVKLSAAKGT